VTNPFDGHAVDPTRFRVLETGETLLLPS